jgi:hypothetical protein
VIPTNGDMGFSTNILTGFLVDKPLASILVLGVSLLSAVPPAVYAILSPEIFALGSHLPSNVPAPSLARTRRPAYRT